MAQGQVARRIGVMGGAFDPPHLAHLALAQAALDQLHLNELRIIPTGQAWHKSRPLSAATHRLAMAELAFASLPQVVVDAVETRRSGPSYTIDTLRDIESLVPDADLFLIIGADQAQALTTWVSWQQILQKATICVADRPYSVQAEVKFDAERAYPERFFHLQLPAMDVSATAVRGAVSSLQNVTALVGESVARYIADHNLYKTV